MTRLYTARTVYSLCYTDICIENGERIPSRFYVVDGEEKYVLYGNLVLVIERGFQKY